MKEGTFFYFGLKGVIIGYAKATETGCPWNVAPCHGTGD